MDPILVEIEKLLENLRMRDCKYLCLVGGLSSSPYVQKRIKEQLGINTKYGLEIITQKQPTLTVVEGAAYFGITKNYIRARILSKTYGVRVNMNLDTANKYGIPNEHIYNNLCFNKERGICHIRNCFDIVANKGDEVLTNQVILRKSKRLNKDQKAVIKYIVCSDNIEPKIVDGNDGCHILGKLKLEFDQNMKDYMVIYTEFHFYDTMLKVFVYPKGRIDLRKEVELSYNNDVYPS